MFRSIGRLMVAVYEPECFETVTRVAVTEQIGEREAARRVTGLSFEAIGQRILAHWGIPEAITRTVMPYPSPAVRPRDRLGRLQLVSDFAGEIAAAVRTSAPAARERAIARTLATFGASLDIDAAGVADLLESTDARVRELARALDLRELPPPAQPAASADALEELPGIALPLPDAPLRTSVVTEPGAKPAEAATLLLAGLQDMTTGLAEGHGVGTVLNVALETLYRGLGYQRAVLCLRNAATRSFGARLTFGNMSKEQVRRFSFDQTPTGDLFWSVLQRNADVHIGDLADETIRARLPAWFPQACPNARSLVLLPIVLAQKPLGFFYADRATTDPVGLTTEELRLLRMLKAQTLLALRNAAAG
jgi:hypothetical protein